MPNQTETFAPFQRATAQRPLLGLTILVVEDSRFACEAMRLLCLQSGARIRRADSLRSARRHLSVYRPSVVIVDLGLPDGSGEDLIRELTVARPRVGAIIGTSGDPDGAARSHKAGADGFLEKPVPGLGAFQQMVLEQLPDRERPRGPRLVSAENVEPDPLTLREDLEQLAALLAGPAGDDRMLAYAEQFLNGLARQSGDPALKDAARTLRRRNSAAQPVQAVLECIADMLRAASKQPQAV